MDQRRPWLRGESGPSHHCLRRAANSKAVGPGNAAGHQADVREKARSVSDVSAMMSHGNLCSGISTTNGSDRFSRRALQARHTGIRTSAGLNRLDR